MEDVLDLYGEPYDRDYPVVCFDEKPCQMTSETRVPLPAKPGEPSRYDYEYRREGTRNLFGFFEPKAAWRHLEVTRSRTGLDFAEQMRYLVEERYPQAKGVRLVLDNLSTHKLAYLYQAFEPERARGIVQKLELHYTPKHASWLNMIEIEFSVLERQCLARHVGSEALLKAEAAAWEAERNESGATVEWRFKTIDARSKLRRLYPSPSQCQ